MGRWDDNRAAPGLAGWQQIQVDPGRLDGLASGVESDVDANVRPRVSYLMARYGYGVAFGEAGVSGSVGAARERYHECVSAAVRQLAGFVNGSTVLVEAARQVCATYTTSDALAAATSRAVAGTLATVAEVSAAVPDDALDGAPPAPFI